MNRKKYRAIGFALLSAVALLAFTACEENESGNNTNDDNSETLTEEYELETIEEQVLFDEAGVKVTVNSIVSSANYGKGIEFTMENTTDQALTFDCKKLIVNGIMTPDHFGDRVQPGDSTSAVAYFGTGMYEYLGIDNVGEIILQFDCYDADYKSVYKSDMISVKTSEYENMDTEVDFDGEKLYEGNGMTIYGKIARDDVFENALLYYIENDTDSEYLFKAEGLTINDVFNENIYGFTMCENSGKLYYLEFEPEVLEDEGITSGAVFEMDFMIADRADLTSIFETGPLEVIME